MFGSAYNFCRPNCCLVDPLSIIFLRHGDLAPPWLQLSPLVGRSMMGVLRRCRSLDVPNPATPELTQAVRHRAEQRRSLWCSLF